MQKYTRVSMQNETEAINKLPNFTPGKIESARMLATGTDDMASSMPFSDRKSPILIDNGRRSRYDSQSSAKHSKHARCAANACSSDNAGLVLEPVDRGDLKSPG